MQDGETYVKCCPDEELVTHIKCCFCADGSNSPAAIQICLRLVRGDPHPALCHSYHQTVN